MRSLYTVPALVAVCAVAVLAKAALYSTAPAAPADLYETPAPVAQDDSTPLVEETSAPVIEETPTPAVSADPYQTPAPVAQDDSITPEEETPTPAGLDAAEETTTPVAQDAYAAEETTTSVAQDAITTPEEETPATVSQDAYTTTAALDALTTPEEETLAPVAQDASTSPAPAAEETPAAEHSNYRRALRRQRQAITTTARPGSNATEESGNATATCTAAAACFHDDDCGSIGDKKGRCIGIFSGKCNCNACLNFLSCTDDSACGGLKGACNATTSRCSCDEGYKANGFAGGFLDAFRELCNVKDCNADNHAEQCFGLPCNSGLCVC